MSEIDRVLEFSDVFDAVSATLEPPAATPPGCSAINWQALLLRRRGLKLREVAEQLHVSPNGVTGRITVAERHWRQQLYVEWRAGRWPPPHRIPDYVPPPLDYRPQLEVVA